MNNLTLCNAAFIKGIHADIIICILDQGSDPLLGLGSPSLPGKNHVAVIELLLIFL
jgi:hypothetical protein